ncbi:MAG: hypothetical protein HOC71_18475 [Candidatus Latescibacteria bacterium]|nr:hypothetical protein [Candidatus Latescibacterota bacterium]
MKLPKMLFAVGLLLTMLVGMSLAPQARVMMTGSITGFGMDILPAANLSVDDWMNKDGMWMITITNGDTKTVKYAKILIDLSSGAFGEILTGELTVINENDAYKSFKTELLPGQSVTVTNTMIVSGAPQMTGGKWDNESFKDEVVSLGVMPEGSYTMKFTLQGYYETKDDPIEEDTLDHTIEIKNPTPPELITPNDNSDDTVSIPRFAWQKPLLSDFSSIKNRIVAVYYNVTLWKMFSEDGSVLVEEDAISRIPIWELEGLTMESVDFDPGTAREELISGRKYCWQVQGLDGEGKPISSTNEGKSDVWNFTIQFTPQVINEPLSFFPFGFTWTPAQTGGGLVMYRARIADNPDFASGYIADGLVMTSFTYPSDAPPLRLGVSYYLELQAIDDSGIPIGEPATTTFVIPISEVTLRAPADGAASSTNTPRFSWQGSVNNYVVRVFREDTDWSYISGAIQGKNWSYDGEDLEAGASYAWNVSPANDAGEEIGESSETWYFSLAAENQVSVMSPVDEEVNSLTPIFTWNEITPSSGQGAIQYSIIIEDDNGTIHSAMVPSTSYQYPSDATALNYATRYYWSVSAERNGAEIGTRSERASFTTLLTGEEEVVSDMEDLSEIMSLIISQFPDIEGFEDKILIEISDETGPITPSGLAELFETFQIINVSEK